MKRKLVRYIRLEYPIPDNYQFSPKATEEFADEVDKLILFINHELEVINSNFRVSEEMRNG